MTNLIDYKIVDDHIAVITLNRPKAANAMSKTLLDELNEVIRKIDHNTTIYCTVVTGADQKAFSAGADLKERKGMSESEVVSAVQYIGETITKIEHMKMPVIAALNGVAFGGGLELALACDLRIAADHIKVGLTETSLAIIPGAGGTQRLTRLIGLGQSKRLIFTAKPIKADEALHIGLVEEIVKSDELVNYAVELAGEIARNGPIAIQQAKIAINQGYQTDLTTASTIEHLAYKETVPTQDRIEGLLSFQEKRKPKYKGK